MAGHERRVSRHLLAAGRLTRAGSSRAGRVADDPDEAGSLPADPGRAGATDPHPSRRPAQSRGGPGMAVMICLDVGGGLTTFDPESARFWRGRWSGGRVIDGPRPDPDPYPPGYWRTGTGDPRRDNLIRLSDGRWIKGHESYEGYRPPLNDRDAPPFREITTQDALFWCQQNDVAPPPELIADVGRSRRGPVPDGPPPVEPASSAKPERITPGSRAMAAALDLKNEGLNVSLKAACERAGVDRANVRKHYPNSVDAIQSLARPDRRPRRGAYDGRTGRTDAVDEGDE